MLKAAITGNIGSGKTTVCKIFESLGIPVFYADTEARKLYSRADVAMQVRKIFGNGLFDEKGNLLRQKLAGIVFRDPAALQKLNGILHPRLMEVYMQWLRGHAPYPYTLHEAAVIFENHLENRFDFIINVSCPERLRLARVRQRDHFPEWEIKNRMARQWPEKEKNERSDAVILNDGKHLVIPQVLKIHALLVEKQKQWK